MSARAFRSISPRTSRVLSVLALAAVAVAWAVPGWSAATPGGAAPTARPTMAVTPGPTAEPAAVTRIVPSAVAMAPSSMPAMAPMPAASAPAMSAMPAASAPVSLVPSAGGAAGAAATAPSPTVEVGTITQPFVATVTGDKVYLRSGPDTKYYEIGQLVKGDLVYVVGVNKGWYLVLPPNGAFCLVAREFLDVDTGGAAGTIKGDPVNVRAGSAIYRDSDYAILPPPLRKGTRVKVVGSTDKYYQIAPPEKAYFYVSAQYVKAAPGTEYKVAQLKLPPGVTGPGGVTAVAPTSMPAAAGVVAEPGAGVPAGVGGGTAGVVPTVAPKVTYSEIALTKYNEASAKYQEESKKPAGQQNVEPILQDFKDVLAMDNISPSVKNGCVLNIAALERTITVQRLIKEQAISSAEIKTQTSALREVQDAADKAVAEAKLAGPFTAEGQLQTSTIVAGKYALVNPRTQRVVAYVDPTTASIDVGMFVGKYIGVRGVSNKMAGSDISVIQVNNVTAMPQPK